MTFTPNESRSRQTARGLPQDGSKILFFSGGTALRPLARVLKRHTHRSIHLITPFDSGGSSAQIRTAFGMPSIGDLRNRVLALADEAVTGNPYVYAFLSHRLSSGGAPRTLHHELQAMATGNHPLLGAIRAPLREALQQPLRTFVNHMPTDFDLRIASMGNLVLTGSYLECDRDLHRAIDTLAALIDSRGVVRPVVQANLHLAGRLQDGSIIGGQHVLTGYGEAAALEQPIEEVFLVSNLEALEPVRVAADAEVLELLDHAELIAYPMGSFFTSILATLLPAGIGQAVVAQRCPKIYIPNTGTDCEQQGLSVADCVHKILDLVRADVGTDVPPTAVIDAILVDTQAGIYPQGLALNDVANLGIQIIDGDLAASGGDRLDPERLTRTLLSLA